MACQLKQQTRHRIAFEDNEGWTYCKARHSYLYDSEDNADNDTDSDSDVDDSMFTLMDCKSMMVGVPMQARSRKGVRMHRGDIEDL